MCSSENIDAMINANNKQEQQLRFLLKRVGMLDVFLENGQESEFRRFYSELMDAVREDEMPYALVLEVYGKVSSVFISYLNRFNLYEKINHVIDLNKLFHRDKLGDWKEVERYYLELAEKLFEMIAVAPISFKPNDHKNRSIEAVLFIQQYISEHLDDDLSLGRLAEMVYFNPSYFSRLFKQTSGLNLFAYIHQVRLNRAKELLVVSNLKIYEIAAAVGYESAPYFTRIFKKAFQIGPQEYRNTQVKTSK